MDPRMQSTQDGRRRGFLKLTLLSISAGLVSPIIAACSPRNEEAYEVDIVLDQSRAGHGVMASLPKSAAAWSSGLLFPGQRYSRKFDIPGTYVYFSLPRLSPSMMGTLIVE